jgi:uncharacterized protein
MREPDGNRIKGWPRFITITAGLLALLYFAVCMYFWATQAEKVFLPLAAIQTTPARMGMAYDEVNIPVGIGEEKGILNGFWVPVDDTNAPLFLYLHGNNCNISKNLDHIQRLHQLGFSVLLVDYRGFGKSVGSFQPSEIRVYEDAEEAWNYLIKVRGARPQRTFIYGHSLGGAIAIELATHHSEAAGLITESTFTRVVDMAKLQYSGALRLLPLDLFVHQRFESLQKITSLKIPLLVIHGTWDQKIPFHMSEQLYDAAPQPKKLLLVEGGEHVNSGSVGWMDYRKTVTAFVREQLK